MVIYGQTGTPNIRGGCAARWEPGADHIIHLLGLLGVYVRGAGGNYDVRKTIFGGI